MTFWVAGAAVAGGLIASSGASDAAATQAAASDRAAQLQKQTYDEQVARNQPFARAGLIAQNRLMQLLGLGGTPGGTPYMAAPAAPATAAAPAADAGGYYAMVMEPGGRDAGGTLVQKWIPTTPAAAPAAPVAPSQDIGLSVDSSSPDYGKYARDFGMQDFEADPGYAFRVSEGQKALDRQAAARGGLISGGALKAAQRFGQDLGSQEYMNAFNRYQTNRANQLNPLGSLMSSGQSAVNNQAAAAGNYGNAGANAIMAAGQATAAGQLGVGNTWNNALGTMASTYQNQQNFNNWLNRSQSRPSYGYVPYNADTVIPMQPGGGY